MSYVLNTYLLTYLLTNTKTAFKVQTHRNPTTSKVYRNTKNVILTVAVLGFTFGGSGVAIIAAGGTDLYCHSEPPTPNKW